MSEQIEKCPICGSEMFVNEEGKLQCPSLIYHLKDPKTKPFMKGKWFGQRNIKIDIKYQNQPVSENQVICDTCSKKISAKEIEIAISRHHISYAAYGVNRQGEYNQKLTELYEKIRNGKINLEEALEQEEFLRKEYFDKPRSERPIGQTSGHVAIKCPNCKKKLGNVVVVVSAHPETRSEQPSCKEYVMLPKTAEQERLIAEYFTIPKNMKLEQWFNGEDITSFIKKLEKIKENLKKVPYMRGDPQRELNSLNALIYRLLETLQREIQTRPDRIYTLLKSPPVKIPSTV